MSGIDQTGDHVGELLSGLVDNELTQQEGQRVKLHLEECATCRTELQKIESIRGDIGKARLSNRDQENWRESMNDATVKTSRGIGWLLFVGGLLVAAGVAAIEILKSFPGWGLTGQIIVGGIYGGLLLLFVSVLRQRLVERKKDRYKDVEI